MAQVKLVSVVVGGICIVLGVWFATRDEAPRTSPAAEAPEQTVASRGLVTEGAPSVSRAADLAEPRSAVEESARDVAASESVLPANAWLTGRVVDDDTDQPVAGASVRAVFRLHEGFSNLDLDTKDTLREVGETASDDTGAFRLQVTPDAANELVVRARGYADLVREHAFGGEERELRLVPAAVFEGQVTRASDGSPRAGVLVRGWEASTGVERFEGTTDGGGFFRFDQLEHGVLNVEVRPLELASPAWQTIELPRGGRVRKDFALEDGILIHGLVTNQATGEPIPDAEVGHGWTFQRRVRTDADGRYALRGFGGPGTYDVHVRAPGYGGDQHEFDYDDMPTSDVELDFALASARAAFGRVVDANGDPLEDVYAAGVASSRRDGLQFTDWESTATDAEGRFRFESLDRRLSHQLVLRKEGFGSRVYDFPEDEWERSEVDLGTLTLHPPAVLRGTLLSDQGEALPNYKVLLRGTNEDIGRLRSDESRVDTMHYTDTRTSQTDGEGRFRFGGLAGGAYEVFARVVGKYQSGAELPVTVGEGEVLEGLELVLPLGKFVRGRVLSPDGEPLARVRVMAFPTEGEGRELNGVESGADGRFELNGITDDEVDLIAFLTFYNFTHPEAPLAANAPLRVSAGEEDVVLRLNRQTILRGVVLDPSGEPVPKLTVSAHWPGTSRQLAWGETDDEGRFALEVPEATLVDLETAQFLNVGEGRYLTTEAGLTRKDVPTDGGEIEIRLEKDVEQP